jgi:CheY-like chemotaxis protein
LRSPIGRHAGPAVGATFRCAREAVIGCAWLRGARYRWAGVLPRGSTKDAGARAVSRRFWEHLGKLNEIGASELQAKALREFPMVQLASGFASATKGTSTSRPLTVLVVEDDPSLLSLAAYVFGKKGHHVLTGVDAVGALALLHSHSVDLLFTDIDLAHGTDGVTLARAARALRSDLPVAYTSGRIHLLPDEMVPGSVFLPKPYRLAEVIGLPDRLARS